MNVRQEVQAIIIRNHKILIAKKGGAWRLPKGGLEEQETHIEALHRELLEEVNLAFDKARQMHAYTYDTPDVKHDVRVYVVHVNGEPTADSKELQEIEWVEPERALALLAFAEEKRCITEYLGGL
jgi:8-oxo-dGTP pyrophosphatase MutT (NUDIX family)